MTAYQGLNGIVLVTGRGGGRVGGSASQLQHPYALFAIVVTTFRARVARTRQCLDDDEEEHRVKGKPGDINGGKIKHRHTYTFA